MPNALSALLVGLMPFLTPSDFFETTASKLASHKCEAPVWQGTPTVDGAGLFKGELSIKCRIETDKSSYQRLFDNMLADIVRESETVHSGPIDGTFEGHNSKVFDVTTRVDKDGLRSVRSDVNVVLIDDKHFALDGKSKAIDATGFAKNIKRLDARIDLTKTDEFVHQIVIWNRTHVQKPSLIPTSFFKSEVISEMESRIKQTAPEVITQNVGAM